MFFSHPALLLAALGSGATQFITYGAGQFHHAVPDAREGHDARRSRHLLRAGRRRSAMSGGIFVSGRVIDRFTRRRSRPMRSCRPSRWRSRSRSTSPSSGRRLAAGAAVPDRADVPQLFLSVLVGHAGAGGGAARPARDVRRAAAAGDELHRPRSSDRPMSARRATSSARAIPTLAADRALHADAVLRDRHRALPVAGARAAPRGSKAESNPHDLASSSRRSASRSVHRAVRRSLGDSPRDRRPVVDAPAGAVRGHEPRARSASSRASPMRSRRSAPRAGGRRRRCRAWQGVRDGDGIRAGLHAAASRHVKTSTRATAPMSEDCLTLNIWAPANAQKRAGVRLDPWRRAGRPARASEPLYDGARLRRARHRRRLDQLSARRARLSCASRS